MLSHLPIPPSASKRLSFRLPFAQDSFSLSASPSLLDRPMANPPTAAEKSKTAELDMTLYNIGFEIDVVSAARINGRITVTESLCQPFKVLHGGISALIAEALASIGAHVASGYRRVAGIQLSVNHHRSARLGDRVIAEATPLQLGKTIQVWEVSLWKMDASNSGKGVLVSTSKVTLLTNMPVPDDAKKAEETLKKYARL